MKKASLKDSISMIFRPVTQKSESPEPKESNPPTPYFAGDLL
jgi:hypothetical protein